MKASTLIGTAIVLTAGVLAAALVWRSTNDDPGEEPAALTSPYTGAQIQRLNPVLAVKVDNAPPARPQTGLRAADIVYVEPVEGGLTRFLAVFSSQLPPKVGPVRSARESDLELLRQFGRPALGYSGANAAVRDLVGQAPVVDVSADEVGAAYARDASRPAPYNLYATPQALVTAAAGASTADDIGYRFGPAPQGGVPTSTRTVAYPAASIGFQWSPRERRWVIALDGEPATDTTGGRLGAATVVVQKVTVRESRFVDAAGNPTPYAVTVGSGTATVLRDGAAFAARWSRPEAQDGTEFTTENGDPMPFATGPVWVILTAG